MNSDYPGQGMPWADFLHHRRRVIEEFVGEGKSFASIAVILSMDAGQVQGIYENGATDTASMLSRERIAKAAMRHPVPRGVFSDE
jgi:hypothetical protein